jgi:outer membrane protein assembly factor BamD (BamD/ComL family)
VDAEPAAPVSRGAGAITSAGSVAAPDAVRTSRNSLSDELALIDAARTALNTGDAAGGQRALDAHALKFPAPHFAPEALLLRIDVLRMRGQAARAEQLRRRFLTEYPGHPLAVRLRVSGAAVVPHR